MKQVLGNVITDSFRESSGADIAFENSGGIRAQLMKGDISFGDLYKVLPFDNTIIATLDMKGKDVLEILEDSTGRAKDNLQLSGITMDIDTSRPPGNRVSNVKVNGKRLEENKVYKVATDDFIATGVDYKAFKKGENLEYGQLTIEAAKSYIENHSPITSSMAKIEKRHNFL